MTIPKQAGRLFIDGKWVSSRSDKTFQTYNPATGDVLAHLAEAGPEDVDLAVRAARKAFDTGAWPATTPMERGRILTRMGDIVMRRADEIARLETLDVGKPISNSRKGDIPGAAECFHYNAGWATKILGNTIPVGPDHHVYTMREPVGVVGAIVPWNFPFYIAVAKVAPALAAGCTVVLKPAEQTPLTALLLGDIANEAGLPPGVLNIVTGDGPGTGAAIVRHPAVDKISFTGETTTGQEIVRAAAATMKKVTLELGGKSPHIIFADADLDAAAKSAFLGIAFNCGQVCTAGSRLLVEKKIHGEVLGRIMDHAKQLKPGDPLQESTRLGPLVSEEQLAKVTRYIETGRKEGAKLLVGGDRPAGKGYFVNPTIFEGVDNRMKIAQEEIFGPVLAAIDFGDVDDVVAKANDVAYGLAAGIWTRDVRKAHAVARALKAGTVWVNSYSAFDVAVPFGGYKMSGVGRENGWEGVEVYTQLKSVWVGLE